MAMQQEYIHLVTRLKQQPRLGMADNPQKEILDIVSSLTSLYQISAKGYEDLARNNSFALLSKGATDAYEKVNLLEQQNRKLSESFNVNTGRAAALGFQFDQVGKKLGVNSDKLKQYAGELKSLLPGQASYIASSGKFGEQILKQTEMLRNKFGLSAEAAEGFIKAQTLMGGASAKNFESIVKEATTFGESLRGEYEGATTDILETIGTLDSATVAIFGSTPDKRKGLFAAAIQAKKLGIELSKVKDIADASLDVEQAIASELELQILGADTLNMAALQKARYEGDMNKILDETARFVKANGEQFAKNPQLLKAGAQALSLQESDLFDMYSRMQLGEELQKEAAAGKTARAAELNKLIEEENKLRIAAGKKAMAIDEEASFLADKRSESAKQADLAQQAQTANQLSGYSDQKSFVDAVQSTAKMGMDLQKSALSSAASLTNILKDSDTFKALFGIGSALDSLKTLVSSAKGAGRTPAGVTPVTPVGTNIGTEPSNDLFIPAGGANTVVSGPFGSFALDSRDDVLAAPNIREAAGGGADAGAIASAVAAALQGMSFQVTNVFDGDKIASSLQIRRGQTMNNLGNIA